jgi:hypothetical protein
VIHLNYNRSNDAGNLHQAFLAKGSIRHYLFVLALRIICNALAFNLMALGAEEVQAVGVNPRGAASFNCASDCMYINFLWLLLALLVYMALYAAYCENVGGARSPPAFPPIWSWAVVSYS